MPDAPAHPVKPAGRSAPAIVVFTLVAVGVAVADVAIKAASFARVADAPIQLTRSPKDGTTLIQVPASDQEATAWHTLPRMHPDDPASAIPYHDPVTLVPGTLSLKLTINTGAVFGVGKGSQWLFVIVSVFATTVIIYIFARSDARAYVSHVCLALILAGALGNLYDRVRFNAVRDMFWLFPGVELPFGLRWPSGDTGLYPWIFNLADAALVVGVFTLLVLMWREPRQPDARKRQDPAANPA